MQRHKSSSTTHTCTTCLLPQILQVKNYPKSFTYKPFYPAIGAQSILVSDEPTWHRQRKAFNRGISYSFLKNLVPVFMGKSKRLWLDQLAESMEVARVHDLLTMLSG